MPPPTTAPRRPKQSLTYNFRVDTKAPVVESATVSGSTLEVVISDESPLAGFTVNDPNSGQYIYRDVIRNDADQTYSQTVVYRYKGNRQHERDSRRRLQQAPTSSRGTTASTTPRPSRSGRLPVTTAATPGTSPVTAAAITVETPAISPVMTAVTAATVCSPSMGGRWVTDGYRWAWQCNNGAYLRNGWYLIDGRYYYFDGNGYMSSGMGAR